MTLDMSMSLEEFERVPCRTSDNRVQNVQSDFWRSLMVSSSCFTQLCQMFSEAIHPNRLAIVVFWILL